MDIMKPLYQGLVALALVATATACSDDEHYDVVGNPDNLIYFGANSATPLSLAVKRTPQGAAAETVAKIPVKILRPASGNIAVTAVADTTLTEAFNEANGTSYHNLPASALPTEDMKANIAQGATLGTDSITVRFNKDAFNAVTDGDYLLPVRLSETSGDGQVSRERGTAYIKLSLSTVYIEDNLAPADFLGKAVADYTAWTATYDNGITLDAAELFDGDLTNGPQLRTDGNDGKTNTIVIDMKQDYALTGLRLNRYYHYYEGYYFSEVTWSVSDDNQNWTTLGTCSEGQMYSDDEYNQYIGLLAPVTARYLKLQIKSGYSNVSSLSELSVYAQ